MSKRNKIIYWVSTIWLALGMTSTGIAQLMKMKEGAGALNSVIHLGYPEYFLSFIGIMKLLGVVALYLPKLPRLKEWAYAGFTFIIISALYSHIAAHQAAMNEIFGLSLLLVLTSLSYYFRPEDKKVC